MNIIDIIKSKQEGNVLTEEEIEYVVEGYTNDCIPDYQMSAFLMAVYFKGMTDSEATTLTLKMRDSGDIIDNKKIEGIKVDKHSTGGVGDKTTLILGPMVASFGIKFPKMSGRGLGHTGGTIDKLESIPGFNVSISNEDFINEVNSVGMSVVAQSGNLAPADKKIYALRDVTSTVASIPLIASSIMSKKLAANDDVIMLDVKVGSGAFMKNIDDATSLAKLMVSIGRNAGKKMSAILTNMEEPLGNAVGNSIEVIEAIETLKGNGPADLEVLCSSLCAYILMDALGIKSLDEAYDMANKSLHDGSALNKFKEFVKAQGGNPMVCESYSLFKPSERIISYKAEESGYIEKIDAYGIGLAASSLGAGRHKLGDNVDYAVGIYLHKKVGDKVSKGDKILDIYSDNIGEDLCLNYIRNSIKIGKKSKKLDLILKVIR